MRSCSYRTKEISAVSTKKAEQPSGACGSAVRRIRLLSIVWALALLAPVHESGAFPLGEGTFGYSVFGDSDNDLAPDSVDVFPNDPNEAIDSDWDGIGDNADEDDDNDLIPDAEDAFPFDPNESIDTDSDGLGNNGDVDDDGDGVLDSVDPFPLDSAEFLDSDGDGIGDVEDLDDDNDGVIDEEDFFQFHNNDAIAIREDFNQGALPFGVTGYRRGILKDPAVSLGYNEYSWMHLAGGRYRANGDPESGGGDWRESLGGYVLTSDWSEPYYPSLSRNDPSLINVDRQALSDPNRPQWTLRSKREFRFSLIEKGPRIWRLQYTITTFEYSLDDDLALDMSRPVRISRGELLEMEMLSPTLEFESFSAAELVGAWTINNLLVDDISLAAHCTVGRNCSDILRFNADKTGITELSNRSVTWRITAEGYLEITFADNGSQLTVQRVEKSNETSIVLLRHLSSEQYLSEVSMMVKRDAPAPTDISEFLGKFLSSGFYVTNEDNERWRRSTLDGGLIDNFGFSLEASGVGERAQISSDDVENSKSIEGSIRFRAMTWSGSGDRIESELCFASYQLEDEVACYYVQDRAWDLIKVSGGRLYVHETLGVRSDFDFDGNFDPVFTTSRTNFYEVLDYYDLSDVDRDGVANENDSFPVDEREWNDSDGDGIGDNADPDADADSDGVVNAEDAFPYDLVASLDSDGDGFPDAWNSAAPSDLIGATSLQLDAFPRDATENIDSDNDGIGDNGDLDDDGDGILDPQDAFPLDNTESLDTDNDGVGNNADTDDDNDGVSDEDDAFPQDTTEFLDSDSDGIGNNADLDDDADGVVDTLDEFPEDPSESADTDQDGLGNNADTDDDNDGFADSEDAFPLDTNEWTDTDNDGIGNNTDLDDDGDGVNDDGDQFPLDPKENKDSDLDGIGDNADEDDDNDGTNDASDAFPFDFAESLDTDGDGVGNNSDDDDDGDGILDPDDPEPLISNVLDTDGDGIKNIIDNDDDGDGFGDEDDSFPLDATEWTDTDNDGIGNNTDLDDDGDGVQDRFDAFPEDASEDSDYDSDGLGNNADDDDDGDGIPDNTDAFPLDSSESRDTDDDGIGDNEDADDDGDGVLDFSDAFPLDPTESTDTDSDGIGNNTDEDDDGDGVLDASDLFPLDSSESLDADDDGIGDNADQDDDGDGVLDSLDQFPNDSSESLDTDGDGLGNNADQDDDGDAVPDEEDAFSLISLDGRADTDRDGYPNDCDAACEATGMFADIDDDNDGVIDAFDAFPLDAEESLDADLDGIGDNADLDDDNDGTEDLADSFPNDPRYALDDDLDSIPDEWENAQGLNSEDPSDGELDPDRDGVTSFEEYLDGTAPLIADSVAQIIFVSGSNTFGVGNSNIVNLVYETSDLNSELSGLGIRVHYDSSVIESLEFEDVFSDDLVNSNSDAVVDSENFDDDSTTDRYLAAAWASISGSSWPGSQPVTLAKLRVAIKEGADLSTVTPIRVTSSGTSVGYKFSSDPFYARLIKGNLDIDADGQVTPLTDGLLLIRSFFGFTGEALISGVVGLEAERSDAESIQAAITELGLLLDVDQDEDLSALSDGLLIIRYLFGFRGDSLTDNAVPSEAQRKTAAEIEEYIQSLVPAA